MPVKHIVMFEVKADASVDDVNILKQRMLELPKEMPELFITYELGVDLKLAGGQSHPAGKNRSICWTACFTSVADYETYEKHPAHIKAINDIIKPMTIPGTRAAIQYEYNI